MDTSARPPHFAASMCVDDCCADKEAEIAAIATRPAQRRVLWVVLAINAVMFVVEATAGVVVGSAALLADSVDMFGDAAVYALSLFALERGIRWRAGAALAKGGIVVAFGMWVLIEVGRRAFTAGTPSAEAIGVIGFLALAANLTCLALLWRFRAHDINMSSTFECSRNDVVANFGVLVAAAGVAVTGAAWPDLLVGTVVAAVFLRSAWSIVRAAWHQFHRAPPGSTDPREHPEESHSSLELVVLDHRDHGTGLRL